MKRLWLYAIGAVLVIAAAIAIVLAIRQDKDHTDKTGSPAAVTTTKAKQACAIFTLADAKQILGDSAKGGANPIYENNQSDLAVSSCGYTQDSGSNAPVSSTKSASLLVRAPLTDAGVTTNQNQFGQLRPADSQAVDGYGDGAYWDPQFGQLNILKHNTWYVLSNGPLTPSARTLDQAKRLADVLIDKL